MFNFRHKNPITGFYMLLKANKTYGFFSKLSIYVLLAFLSIACGDFPKQYSDINRSFDPTQISLIEKRLAIEDPTLIGGAQETSFNSKKERTEEEKDRQTRENSLQPVDYSTGSAGNINLETTYEESLDILNPLIFIDTIGLGVYKEGMTVRWRRDPPLVPQMIVIRNGYQGEIDLGLDIGKGKIGDSFVQQFDLSEKDIQKDEKALQFILSLYRHLSRQMKTVFKLKNVE